jgi:2-polyprenyl-6-hydroxyphenyl methylase/3-demethylubiquinone-9 3-methyltransferase
VQLTYRRVSAGRLRSKRLGHSTSSHVSKWSTRADPASIVAACATLVKPGGLVFFSTINRNAKSFLFAIVGAEYVLNLLPKGTHEYARFIRPSELSRACRDAGLTVFDLTGMTYNPVTKIYSLGRDVDVNYLLHAVKPVVS